MCKSAGSVDSFVYFSPVQFIPSHTDIQVLRPLAKCSRTDIFSLCQEQSLQWVKDEKAGESLRRKLLEDDPELKKAISGYAFDLQRVRSQFRRKGH